jgi:hypothetical protein
LEELNKIKRDFVRMEGIGKKRFPVSSSDAVQQLTLFGVGTVGFKGCGGRRAWE